MPSEKSLANLRPFKPGQSGNPKGRPPGRSLTSLLREALDKKREGSKKTVAQHIVDAIIVQVLKGNAHVLRVMWDRLEPIELGGPEGGSYEELLERALARMKEIDITLHVKGKRNGKNGKNGKNGSGAKHVKSKVVEHQKPKDFLDAHDKGELLP